MDIHLGGIPISFKNEKTLHYPGFDAGLLKRKCPNPQTQNQEFELHNVTGEIVTFQGKKALKIERDLTAISFDSTRVEATVDEPHYARLLGLEDFENGTIEVKMYSQLKVPAPYSGIAGFIGLFFRVQEDDSAFESIYVRPKVGRSDYQ